ncbi:MAG TPA: hypothetical protein VLA68_05975 [Nitrososphaera sp.]|nr:hypothetical protein [Nitrososphaera sp.]
MTFISGIDYREKNILGEEEKCALCGAALIEFKYRAMPQWKVSGMICSQCYDKKLMDYYIQPDRRGVTKR